MFTHYCFIVSKCFDIPLYIIPQCFPVINIVKKIPTIQYLYEFFTDFLTTKLLLKISGKYLKKLFKILVQIC